MPLTVFVPEGEPTSYESTALDQKGKTTTLKYVGRINNGRWVIDVPQAFFRRQLWLGRNGLKWERENLDAIAWLADKDHSVEYDGTFFPGAHRPPPTPPAPEPALGMVRLIAPEGVVSYSHNGDTRNVGEDGSITVDDKLAHVLKSHGFMVTA